MRQKPQTTTVVEQGDTLNKIAAENNTTVDAILEANPDITDPNLIQPGQVIKTGSEAGNILTKTGDLVRNVTGIGSEQGPLEGKRPNRIFKRKTFASIR